MIITRAPLRISFFGGGTDYPGHFLKHGGAVLGTAIDQYAFITATRFHSALFDYNIRVAYRAIELVNTLDDIRHAPFREALRKCGLERDIEVNYVADLPAKTGLGSSSTFVVALLQALHAFKRRQEAGIELAYEAIHFERKILGESVGCQDQTFAAVGGFNVLEFVAEDDIRVHPILFSERRAWELEEHLMMFFTGVTRGAEEVVRTQLTKLEENKDRYLRMRKQVDKGYAILTGGQSLTKFGELLHEAWVEKRGLHSVISNSVIDESYEKARAAGAIGGKLLGAGSGGFVLLFVPPERHAAVRQALAGSPMLCPRSGGLASQVIFNDTQMRQPAGVLLHVAD